MTKYKFDGWVEKGVVSECDILCPANNDGTSFLVGPFQFKRGRKLTWCSCDWPPRKVKITIEIED